VGYTQEVTVNKSEKDEDYDNVSQPTPLPLLNWDWKLLTELQKKNKSPFSGMNCPQKLRLTFFNPFLFF
jgi:hypothetical protein